jgi:phosphatidate cytidylyltransferase
LTESPGPRSSLARRLATAAVALPVLLAVLFLGPPLLLVAIVAAAVGAGLLEFYGLLAAARVTALRLAGAVVAAAVFLDVAFELPRGAPLWPAAVVVLALATLRRGAGFHTSVPGAAATLLGSLYLGGLGGTLAALRLLEPSEQGEWRVALLLATVMVSDTAAFFAGRAFGRRPLAPAVSPGKTVEGALAGLLGGAAGALALRSLGLPWLPVGHAVALGVLVAALGAAGDLFESLLKRWAGVKDSGSLFPGHGGMLDRLDSLLFGAPVLYYYFSYFS